MIEMNIHDIVETYDDLHPRQRKRILAAANNRCNQLGLEDFQSQYEVVAEMVEQSRTRHHRSFDVPLRRDSDSNLYTLVGEEDEDLAEIFEEKATIKRIPTLDVLHVIGEHLTDAQLSLLRQLITRSEQENPLLDVKISDVVKNIDQVRERLDKFARFYMKDGKIFRHYSGLKG